MSNTLNPLAAGHAEFWLPLGIVPVPMEEDGTYLVEPNVWAMKSDDEIKRHYAENPTQNFDIMMPESWILVVAHDWTTFVKARPSLKSNGVVERFRTNFIHDGSDVAVIICEQESEPNIDGLKDVLGKANRLFIPSLTYRIGNDEGVTPVIVADELPDEDEQKAELEPVPPTPFDQYSLLGHENDMARFAVNFVALLGTVIMMGQFGLIYAQPNAGKTLLTISLLLQAVEEGRADPRRIYYINADDNPHGIMEKLVLFREMGAHTLVPGQKSFDPEKLAELMHTMIKNDECIGVILIVDTLKCFTDLMDKKKSTQFGKLARQFVMAGGTFIGLAHINKNPSGNGKPVYAGTSDFHEACDVACYLIPVETTAQGDKIVKFELFKNRSGANRDEAYSYSGSKDASYHQRVASVQKVDPNQMHKYEQAAQLVADQLVTDTIIAVLKQGTKQKMALAKDVSGTTKASRRQVIEILERYAGDDPTKHKWDFVVAERGAKVFALHPTPDS